MALQSDAAKALDSWYNGLQKYQDGLPSKGSIGAALVVLDRLTESYDLNIDLHVASGQSQIRGLSAANLKKILHRFGESRALSKIGGRSNRGARGDIESLLTKLKDLGLEHKSSHARNLTLRDMQKYIVTQFIPRHFAVKRVKAAYDPQSITRQFLHDLLANAKLNGKAGPVAEHLVGAKLCLKYPHIPIRNKPFTASDVAGNFEGDFQLGNTAIHVTIAPMPELFEKCKENLDRGWRVYLLVPGASVEGARQNASLQFQNRIAVEAIESFVANNVEELAEFDERRVKTGLRRLLEKYNERVAEVETDPSLKVEIPQNL